jgi:hypothetical protein
MPGSDGSIDGSAESTTTVEESCCLSVYPSKPTSVEQAIIKIKLIIFSPHI